MSPAPTSDPLVELSDIETAVKIRTFDYQNADRFSWPTDGCGYLQGRRFRIYRETYRGATLESVAMDYAQQLEQGKIPPYEQMVVNVCAASSPPAQAPIQPPIQHRILRVLEYVGTPEFIRDAIEKRTVKGRHEFRIGVRDGRSEVRGCIREAILGETAEVLNNALIEPADPVDYSNSKITAEVDWSPQELAPVVVLAAVREVINKYYSALDRGGHYDVEGGAALWTIQSVLGMSRGRNEDDGDLARKTRVDRVDARLDGRFEGQAGGRVEDRDGKVNGVDK